jgi:hypothetical protein
MNTPNKVIDTIFGNIKLKHENAINKIIKNMNKHIGKEGEEQTITQEENIKYMPRKLPKLLRNLYYSSCREHNNTILTTTHIR